MSTHVVADTESVARLVHEFSYEAEGRTPANVGPGPFGNRMFVAVTDGVVHGERLRGTLIEGGGDWLLVGDDGFGRLDVRGQFETHDGAVIYLSYIGLIEITPEAQAVLGGADVATEFGEHYFVTTPRLESGDPRYAWVNQTAFVGVGRLRPGPVIEFRVSRVELEQRTVAP